MALAQFWACWDIEGKPLGYVRAQNREDAMKKAYTRWPSFGGCDPWDGVL